MDQGLRDMTAYLHAHIPITQHLGVSVKALDERGVRIAAPLAPNLNHRETAFGGSLSSLAILAGWTLIHFRIREAGFRSCRLVIHKSTMEFLSPVEGDFEAVGLPPAPDEWDGFSASLRRKGKGRIGMRSEIRYAGRTAARHEGLYVAVAESAAGSVHR